MDNQSHIDLSGKKRRFDPNFKDKLYCPSAAEQKSKLVPIRFTNGLNCGKPESSISSGGYIDDLNVDNELSVLADPLGSYTGIPADPDDMPIQDSDDL